MKSFRFISTHFKCYRDTVQQKKKIVCRYNWGITIISGLVTFSLSPAANWSLDAALFCSFLLQLQTELIKSLHGDMQSEVQAIQELHLHLVNLCCAYSSHLSIISIVVTPLDIECNILLVNESQIIISNKEPTAGYACKMER